MPLGKPFYYYQSQILYVVLDKHFWVQALMSRRVEFGDMNWHCMHTHCRIWYWYVSALIISKDDKSCFFCEGDATPNHYITSAKCCLALVKRIWQVLYVVVPALVPLKLWYSLVSLDVCVSDLRYVETLHTQVHSHSHTHIHNTILYI